MWMRPNPVVLAFCLCLGLPAAADTKPADCGTLAGLPGAIMSGYSLSAAPAGEEDGWCVLDGAALKGGAPDQPDITVKRLRIRGFETEGKLVSLDIDLSGLRVTPKIGDTDMDDRLRSLFRLQTADLRLSVNGNNIDDRLELRGGKLVLSGGTEVEFAGDVADAELSAPSVLLGRLTRLDLRWKNDGRLLRPAMEAAGEALVEGAKGSTAVDAAREALGALAGALPTGSLAGETADALKQLIVALPQGRGRLSLEFVSEGGIGAVQFGLAALSDDPASPEALARLLAGCVITVDWQPGLAP
jgi:hypothetical protein